MITEFTCGIYTATFNIVDAPKWFIKANNTVVALVDEDGKLIRPSIHMYFDSDMLIQLAVLMNNIKRQYKQQQTN